MKSGKRFQKRGFPATRRPQKRDELARLDRQVDVRQRGEPVLEYLADVMRLKRGPSCAIGFGLPRGCCSPAGAHD
jgi:hypothetical protein